ncbi:hypothetical protein [Streptomyces sp. NPDC060001]|uniref:hypothetical protein n=1 Tax=Streptomyces sp. NPDC060001 TaxID=3347032 RepID=UPI00369D750C
MTTKTTDDKPAPAKKPAAKRTPAKPGKPRQPAPGKPTKPAPSASVPKDQPADTSTVVDTREPLTVRRRVFVGPHKPTELASIRAALASASLRLPVPVMAWNGSNAQLADGVLLTHNPGPDRLFTAHVACRHGSIHGWAITSLHDLAVARSITSSCGRKHAANTPGDDGIEFDWNKALVHGIRPTTRLAEGLITAKKAAADTQSLNRDDIAAGLEARTAEAETPKEHPQP